jgi:hypothetical protein
LHYQIGEYVENKGVYAGVLKNIDDLNGSRLAGEFNIWAMPQDLGCLRPCERDDPFKDSDDKRAIYSPKKTRQIIAGLRGICGHDGTMIWNAGSVYKAIRDKNFKALGKWQLPLPEVLMGRNQHNEEVQEGNLWAYQNIGAFKGTYNQGLISGIKDQQPAYYLSCLWLWHNGRYPKPEWDDAQSEKHIGAYLNDGELDGLQFARANNLCRARPVRYEARF